MSALNIAELENLIQAMPGEDSMRSYYKNKQEELAKEINEETGQNLTVDQLVNIARYCHGV